MCESSGRAFSVLRLSPICFPNEDIVLQNTAINTQSLLSSPRLFLVLGCQLFFLNYSILLAAFWFEYNPSSL